MFSENNFYATRTACAGESPVLEMLGGAALVVPATVLVMPGAAHRRGQQNLRAPATADTTANGASWLHTTGP